MVLLPNTNSVISQQEISNHNNLIYSTFGLLPEFIFTRIYNILIDWSSVDVRTVPNVMYQIRCGTDEQDETIEYQINWFIDCAETYIHNHRNSFGTYCLEGEYEEKISSIVNDNDDTITYEFTRNVDNTLNSGKAIPGTLRHVASRYHFPGNKMHVDTKHFHSVTPIIGSEERVLTFLIKKKYSVPIDTFILSSEPYFHALSDNMRSSTEDERLEIYNKLLHVLIKLCHTQSKQKKLINFS